MIGRTAKCRSLLRPLPSAWASFSLARTGPVLSWAKTLFMDCEWTVKTQPHCSKQKGRLIFDLEAKKYHILEIVSPLPTSAMSYKLSMRMSELIFKGLHKDSRNKACFYSKSAALPLSSSKLYVSESQHLILHVSPFKQSLHKRCEVKSPADYKYDLIIPLGSQNHENVL